MIAKFRGVLYIDPSDERGLSTNVERKFFLKGEENRKQDNERHNARCGRRADPRGAPDRMWASAGAEPQRSPKGVAFWGVAEADALIRSGKQKATHRSSFSETQLQNLTHATASSLLWKTGRG